MALFAQSDEHQVDALLQLLLEQSRDHALILLNPSGTIIAWLAGAEHIFGYHANEVIGQSVALLFTAEDRERGLCDHELRVAAADGRAEDDRWQVRKDGTRIWASGVVNPLHNAAGELVGFGKILRDRTDLKGQLESAERKAQALADADKRKNVFLATLGHEIRNPLAPLTNAIELLRLTSPNDPNLVYPIKIIERQVSFITRLVNDLLDLTRIETGKVSLQMEALNLNDLLGRIVEQSRPAASERNQELRLLTPETPIPVIADPARLQQIVVNLVNNAIKYTPAEGSIWVKATIEGDEAVIRVEDNGVGISPEMLPSIFEMFAQERSSQAMSQGGLGLGLSLVKNLTQLHGGSVQVRSEGKDKGSEFTVRLPMQK